MSEDDLIEASPCKLRNGNWGCKTQQPVSVGDTVRIVTRANKQWRAQITQVVWTDEQTCICETASENSQGGKAENAAPASGKAATGRAAPRAANPPAAADYDTPAYSADAPPAAAAAPTDELDAMADSAAEREDDFDDLMNAMQEFERNQ